MVSPEYLAGFLDGDGHLSLGKIPRRGHSTEHPVRVVVYNSSAGILNEIQRVWGGTLSNVGIRKPGWKPGYALIWTNAAAVGVLTRVVPYLRVKVDQARLQLNFHRHVLEGRRRRDQFGHLMPLAEQEVRFREAYHRRLKRLNARGPAIELISDRLPADRTSDNTVDAPPSPEYLAGLMDAEGCVMIAKCKGSANPQYRARIAISNTYKPILEAVQRHYGGIIADEPARKPGWKHAYQLVWTNGMVQTLLSSITPHLRLKREQAAIVIDLVRHMNETPRVRAGRNGRFFAPFSEEVICYRESLYTRIRALNARGVPAAPPPRT